MSSTVAFLLVPLAVLVVIEGVNATVSLPINVTFYRQNKRGKPETTQCIVTMERGRAYAARIIARACAITLQEDQASGFNFYHGDFTLASTLWYGDGSRHEDTTPDFAINKHERGVAINLTAAEPSDAVVIDLGKPTPQKFKVDVLPGVKVSDILKDPRFKGCSQFIIVRSSDGKDLKILTSMDRPFELLQSNEGSYLKLDKI